MRIDVEKFLFIGMDADRKAFFEKAQNMGFVHFIETEEHAVHDVPDEIKNFNSAIKVLRGLPVISQSSDRDFSAADALVSDILKFQKKLDKDEEELRLLKLEIARVDIFGNFNKSDIEYIQKVGNRVIQYFFAKSGIRDEIELPAEVIYVGTDHGLDYFAAVNPKIVQYPHLIEIKIEKPLGELKQREKQLIKEIAELQDKLKDKAKYNAYLHDAFVSKMDDYNLQTTKNYARHKLEGSLFSIEGWVPKTKIHQLQELGKSLSVHIEPIEIEETDTPPTYLENQGFSRLGEDLIGIYDTPSGTDRDPSLWVLAFFALFFAFIVGDGGYGFFFLGLALYLRYRYPDSKGLGRRMINLITVLSVACIAWGFVTSSFFGLSIGMDNPLRKVSLVSWMMEKKTAYHIAVKDKTYQGWIKEFPKLEGIQDPKTFLAEGNKILEGEKEDVIMKEFSDQILLELALLLGIVHLSISLIRYMDRNPQGIGWILFLVGSFLYFPYFLGVPSFINYIFGIPPEVAGQIGLYMIYAGLALAVMIAVWLHGLFGLHEAINVVQVSADTLSYLRLYALALAGGIVASTMNTLASGLPLVFGILLILIAHSINILLGVMSGIIHGLRLNFLEWYHYSFEGGGKLFRALKLIKSD